MNLNSKKKIKILTDFKSKLEMFNLNKKYLDQIKKNFSKNINVEFINLNKIKKKYDAEIYWGTRINNEIINKIKNLKWIHFGSVGIDKINIDLVKKRKIIITNSKGINTDVMVNLIIFYLIDTSKKLIFSNKKNNRSKYEHLFSNCKDLSKQKVCILGHGDISKKIENYLKFLNVGYKYFSSRKSSLNKIINKKEFVRSINNFDTIINLMRSNKTNLNFINMKLLNKMKKNINLILVGRLSTVDLEDLYKFLSKNKKSNCYIDAIPNDENFSIFKKINSLKNVFISPHIGGYFKEYWNLQVNLFKKNLQLYLGKKKLINLRR